jgi:hypothetical protein
MKRPKRLRDLIGSKVRNTKPLETVGGTIFPTGTLFEVGGVWRGFTLEVVQPCGNDGCHVLRRHYIKTVQPEHIELDTGDDYPEWVKALVGSCVVSADVLWHDEAVDLTLHDGHIVRLGSSSPIEIEVVK